MWIKLCVCVFFIPWGHVNFHDHIWAFQRHLGHMTYMLDSDWLKKNLLRSDWLPTRVACITTRDNRVWNSHFSLSTLTTPLPCSPINSEDLAASSGSLQNPGYLARATRTTDSAFWTKLTKSFVQKDVRQLFEVNEVRVF